MYELTAHQAMMDPATTKIDPGCWQARVEHASTSSSARHPPRTPQTAPGSATAAVLIRQRNW